MSFQGVGMTLHPAVEEVIKLVETTSQLPVTVQPDPALETLAKVRIARPGDPIHILSYNPTITANLDYAIVYQCGFVLRLFQAPPEERFDLGISFRGRRVYNHWHYY